MGSKPYVQMDDLRVKSPIFGSTPKYINMFLPWTPISEALGGARKSRWNRWSLTPSANLVEPTRLLKKQLAGGFYLKYTNFLTTK